MSNIRRRTYSSDGRYFDPSYFVVYDSYKSGTIMVIDIKSLSVVASATKMFNSSIYYSDSYQARIDIGNPDRLILGGRTIRFIYLSQGQTLEIGANVSDYDTPYGYKVVTKEFSYDYNKCDVQIINISDSSTYGTTGIIHDGYGGMYIFTYDWKQMAKLDSNFNVVSITDVSTEFVNAMGSYYTFYDKGIILTSKIISYDNHSYVTDRMIVNLDDMTFSTLATDINEYEYSGNLEPTLVV